MKVDENVFFREALRESEERHRVMIETTMDGFFRTGMQGRILEVNETYCRMSGYSEQELLTMNVVDIEAVHTAEMIAANFRSFAELGPKRFESHHRRKDGSLFDVEISAQYQPIAGGEVVVFIRDITERKKAEEALRQSEAYLAEGQKLTHAGSWAFDLASNKYIYASEESYRIFELDAQEGLPNRKAISRRIHPEDWDRVNADFEKLLREKVDTSSEFRIVLLSGTAKHVQVIRHPVLNSAGDVVRIVGTTIDITERKRAEETQRLASVYNRSLIEASLDPLVTIGPDGKIVDVNAATEAATGRSRGELIGTDFCDYFTEPAKASAGYEQAFREGMVRNYPLDLRHRDGRVISVLYNASVYRDESGRVIGVFAAARDITERKQAEDRLRHTAEALRRSEAYLAEAHRLSHTGSWAYDLASDKYVYASEECWRIFEFDPQEGLPTREAFARQIHPEDYDKVHGEYEKSLREKVDTSIEFRIALPSGAAKHIQAIQHPVLNEAGDVVELMGTAIDITERKRAEEALRRSEAYLVEGQWLSHTGSWSWSPATRQPLYWSEEMFRIFGLNPKEGVPTTETFLQRIHPEDVDRAYELFEKAALETMEYEQEHRIVLPDGTIKHIHVIGHPVLDEKGRVAEYVCTAMDVTDRKRAEEALRMAGAYLSNIIDSMPSILVGMDNARTVTQWNRQAEAFTGIPAGEAIGEPIVHLLPDFASWIMIMGADMDEHRPSSMEQLLIEKEGERRFYDLMLYPLLIDTIGGAVLRIEDVTERARIQELMVQTEKMMSIGGLAAGMAHEINNPLGIITQAAQNIERRISLELHANRKVSEELGLNLEGIRAYFDKRQISDAIASIRTASSRAAKIVANMLQFSRRADTTMEFTSLAQILDQALELAASDYDLKKKYDFRSIDIIKDYQDTPQVSVVSVEIEQVILNLLKNAAQAMTANPPDTKPSITFRLRCEGRYAVLEVEDNGPGMTEDIRRRVFEPFFTTKDPGVGTGLGLSVSYMIVTQNHKGLIEVQSTPGVGTVFKVKLPIEGEQT